MTQPHTTRVATFPGGAAVVGAALEDVHVLGRTDVAQHHGRVAIEARGFALRR